MSAHPPGSFVRVSGTFRDLSVPGAPLFDPASIILRVKDPEGEEQTFAPARDGEGKYHADLVASLPGHWHWRWEADGGAGIDEGSFDVGASAFP